MMGRTCTACQAFQHCVAACCRSTADGLQWFCRACQTRVCHTLKDAARLRNAASQAAADAEVHRATHLH